MFDYTNNKLYIHRQVGKPMYIGRICDETKVLHIDDRDNYFPAGNSLGVDQVILTAPQLLYTYLTIQFRGKKLLTTRNYFWHHSRPANLMNGRTMCFMHIPLFGLDRALQFDRLSNSEKLAQMDLFEIVEQKDPTLLQRWIEAIKNHS